MDARNDLRPTRPRMLALVAALAMVALGFAACGGSDDAAVSDATTSTADGADDYGGGGGGTSQGSTIDAQDFSLTSVTVAPGATVTFSNKGAAQHSVTADDGAFDTDPIKPGTTGTFTAPTEPGAYAYHCKIHASMTGTLTVSG